ncbi:MAG: hypothetical protein KC440_02975, partial [Nitrosarchaeum sp.]|nr:hypothetical protein [Nitrosarchaeum sp.]
DEIIHLPQKLITFNLDGILEIYLLLDAEKKRIIAQTIKNIVNSLEDKKRRRLLLVIPDNAKEHLNI